MRKVEFDRHMDIVKDFAHYTEDVERLSGFVGH